MCVCVFVSVLRNRFAVNCAFKWVGWIVLFVRLDGGTLTLSLTCYFTSATEILHRISTIRKMKSHCIRGILFFTLSFSLRVNICWALSFRKIL